MRIGVLVNPSAGGGRAEGVCRALLRPLSTHPVCSVSGFGAEFLKTDETIPAPTETGYVQRVAAAARAMAAREPELLILVGGDGFAAYVADALLTAGRPVPKLAGVAGGTANVGPIIAFPTLPDDLAALQFAPVGAIEVSDDCGHVAYAFNDLVLGNTYLTTVEGRTVTASAEALYRDGKTVPCAAMADIGHVRVSVNGISSETSLPRVAQAIASTLERDDLYGRAVTGLLCFTPGSEQKAALLLSGRGIVSMDGDDTGFTRPAPMEQLIFGKNDEVVLSNLLPGVSVIADGNPYPRHGDVRLRYHENLLLAAEKKGATSWKR